MAQRRSGRDVLDKGEGFWDLGEREDSVCRRKKKRPRYVDVFVEVGGLYPEKTGLEGCLIWGRNLQYRERRKGEGKV